MHKLKLSEWIFHFLQSACLNIGMWILIHIKKCFLQSVKNIRVKRSILALCCGLTVIGPLNHEAKQFIIQSSLLLLWSIMLYNFSYPLTIPKFVGRILQNNAVLILKQLILFESTCFAKKIWSSLESWTIDPAGSSPGCHLNRKINPWTGLKQGGYDETGPS